MDDVATSLAYRWDVAAFLRAQEAGAFGDARVQLVDGEVWEVGEGLWHGRTAVLLALALDSSGFAVTSTLVSTASLPVPDLWLLRHGTTPVERLSPRINRFAPDDVLLVAEVGDESRHADLTTKAALYARTGDARYGVVARDGVHEHSDPSDDGCRTVRLHRRGGSVDLPDGGTAAVDDLLADDRLG